MKSTFLYEEYSDDKEYRFRVYQKNNYYEVSVQEKCVYSDEYIPDDTVYYFDIPDYKHIADTLERAIDIGHECIKNMIM